MLRLEINVGKSRYIPVTIGVPVLGYRNNSAFLCNELHHNSVLSCAQCLHCHSKCGLYLDNLV